MGAYSRLGAYSNKYGNCSYHVLTLNARRHYVAFFYKTLNKRFPNFEIP